MLRIFGSKREWRKVHDKGFMIKLIIVVSGMMTWSTNGRCEKSIIPNCCQEIEGMRALGSHRHKWEHGTNIGV